MPTATLPPITPLAAADPAALEALLDAVFGADRRARTAYRIRAGMAAIDALSFAMFDGEALAGTLQSWPVALDGQVPLVLVGPVAVAPARQHRGIGGLLMRRLLAEVDEAGADPLVLIGDPGYYGRFGFTADATAGWEAPGPVERHRLLARIPAGRALPATGMLGPRLPSAPAPA